MRRAAATLVLLLGLLAAADARAAEAAATLTPDTIAMGENAELVITITGGNGRDGIPTPAVDGLQILSRGTGSSFSLVNGRPGVEQRFTFAVRPARTGEFTIPPISVNTGQGVLRTLPVTLRVMAPEDAARARQAGTARTAFLTLDLPKREFFAGESAMAEVHLYAQAGRLQRPPSLTAEGFTLGRLQQSGRQISVRTNNALYQRVTWQAPITAVKPGTQTIAATDARLIVPVRRQDPFGGFSDFFDNYAEQVPVDLVSDPAEVIVRPLPTDNVPPGFSGAVGEFEAVLTATPTNLAVGDPVTLRLEVTGHGNFDAMQMPEQMAWQAFRRYPAVAKFEPGAPTGLGGRKIFEQVLVPEQASLDRIPEAAFTFFSPARGRYQTIPLPGVPLVVRPVAAAPVAGQAPQLADHDAAAPDPAQSAAAPGGLRHIRTDLGAPAGIGVPLLLRPWFPALLLLPAAGWAAARAWRLRREQEAADPELHRRRRAGRALHHALTALNHAARDGDAAGFFAALARVLQEALGLALNVPPASVTPDVLDAPAAAPLEPMLRERARVLFHRCDEARFAGAGGRVELEALRAEAAAVAEALGRR
ncbi:MAG: BatD family protein [Limisphaerales bacterium]